MRRSLAGLAAVLLLAGCANQDAKKPAESLFVGIDVSGSFQNGKHFESSLRFLSQYLYARLAEKGGLQPVKALYVGSIGGTATEDNKSFYPIHEFQGKTPEEIYANLKEWFPKSDRFTDFNIFLRQVSDIAQKRNLSMSPITVVLLTDGIPDEPGQPNLPASRARFDKIDVAPLEYMARRVTVRLLYPSPMVTNRWEQKVPHTRVRLWTVDSGVMSRWEHQYAADQPADRQEDLWKWIADTVDYRVRAIRVKKARDESREADDEALAVNERPQAAEPPAPAPKGPLSAAPKVSAKPAPKTSAKPAPKTSAKPASKASAKPAPKASGRKPAAVAKK